MKEGLIFANSRAKSKECELLGKERLMRMMEAKTLGDAMRILTEVNYAGGFIPENEDFYSLLFEEEKIVVSFVKSSAPKGCGTECFFLRNDYHNIKVLYKTKYGSIENNADMFMTDGNYSLVALKEMFDSGKLDFSENLISACAKIDKAFEDNAGSPRLIDVTLDKALYADVADMAINNKNADEYLKHYFEAFIDTTNVAGLLRTFGINGGMSYFRDGFIPCGRLTLEAFEECGADRSKLVKMLSDSYLKDFFSRVSLDDMSGYETAQDNYLLGIFSQSRADMFSVAPFIGYYLAKLNEIKVLRVVFVCIKNKVSEDEMRKRVRELYA